MTEGSLYDRELAALAIKQARGDLIEAIFLLRAFRATLPRFGVSEPIDTAAMEMRRRISATFKDLPGGQVLGPTFDYTHRLLDVDARRRRHAAASRRPAPRRRRARCRASPTCSAADGLIEPLAGGRSGAPVGDLTREPLSFPADRDLRLQNLARGDEGFLLALGYSTQRGYGRTHPFAGEIRLGEVEVEFFAEEVGFAVPLGSITVTECQMINQFKGSATEAPRFTRGYGLAFGHCERKAMSMALVDRALRAARARRGAQGAGAGRGVRAVAFRQRAGDRLRRAPEAAALCRLPVRARSGAPAARRDSTAAQADEPMREAAE